MVALAALGSLPSLPGCLIADPPVFEEPQRTPPFLDLANADPLTTTILKVPRDGATLPLRVPVRSEDAGDPLIATLWINFGDPILEAQGPSAQLLPATFDEQRTIEIDWAVQLRGDTLCQQLTLVVTHLSNLRNHRPQDRSLAAFATWWLRVEDPDRPPPTLDDCPASGGAS